MKVLSQYGYDADERCYVCELSLEEMNLIHKGKVEEGAVVDVPDIYRQARELREAGERIARILRLAARSELLLQSLNAELEQARLDVNDRKAPEMAVIRAHIAYLETLNKEAMSDA